MFLVERWNYANSATVICGAFATYEEAEAFKEACYQEWMDKFPDEWAANENSVNFNVVMTTFYG